MAPKRRQTKNSKRADAFFGYVIPGFFILLACHQQLTKGVIDKYVLAALFLFGLGALGWRIDTILEKYFESRNRNSAPPAEEPEPEPAPRPRKKSPKAKPERSEQEDDS